MRGFLVDELTVIRGGTRLLDGVSAALPAGGCSGVVGPSGSGKSTLLRVLNRLEEPTTGRILLDGRPVTELDVLALRRRVGLVGQRPVLLADRVEQELRIGRPELSARKGAELLERVGLPAGFGQRACGELSGGEAQRVCLARALAVEPQVLLLDEPTSALDGLNVSLIGELARQHVASGGDVVLVSHDVGLVRSMADRVLVLDQGRLIAAGDPDQIDYLRAGS